MIKDQNKKAIKICIEEMVKANDPSGIFRKYFYKRGGELSIISPTQEQLKLFTTSF